MFSQFKCKRLCIQALFPICKQMKQQIPRKQKAERVVIAAEM